MLRLLCFVTADTAVSYSTVTVQRAAGVPAASSYYWLTAIYVYRLLSIESGEVIMLHGSTRSSIVLLVVVYAGVYRPHA